MFGSFIFTALFWFPIVSNTFTLFTYFVPMLFSVVTAYFVSLSFVLYLFVCSYSSLVLFSRLFFIFISFFFHIFQTMSSSVSFFSLTTPVFGSLYRLTFSVPFDVLISPSVITVLVHQNHLYADGSFYGVLLTVRVYYTLF